MDNFKVGEIAILQNTLDPDLAGLECKIVGDFGHRYYVGQNRMGNYDGFCWYVDVPEVGFFAAEIDQLRKRGYPKCLINLTNVLDSAIMVR